MATILVTHGIPAEGFRALSAHQIIIPKPLEAFSEEELLSYVPQADAIVAAGRVTRRVIAHGKKLRIIANYGAGYDLVDIAAAAEHGVLVTNIPEMVTHATAELLRHENVVCTPHIGTNTQQTRFEMAQACSMQILDVLDGKRPANIVNGL